MHGLQKPGGLRTGIVRPPSLVADRLQGAIERVVGVRDGVFGVSRSVAGMRVQEFSPWTLEASLVQVPQCRTNDFGMDQPRVHPDDLSVVGHSGEVDHRFR